MKKEIVIPGITFKQKYEIDDEGNVWTPYRGPRKMKPPLTHKGYRRVYLQTTEGGKSFQVHRLVLMMFSPVEGMDKLEVNHKDGNKENNNLSNLEWCTGSMNVRHSLSTGLKTPAKGESVGGSKLKEENVLQICEMLQSHNYSLSEIGDKFGVSKHCIFDIKRKRSWSWLTKGYNFD